MSVVALPEGAPLSARLLVGYMRSMTDAERTLAPSSREFRAVLRGIVELSASGVMLTRSEVRTATAYLRKVGVL